MKLTAEKIVEFTEFIKFINAPENKSKIQSNDFEDTPFAEEISNLNSVLNTYYIDLQNTEQKITELNNSLLQFAQHNYEDKTIEFNNDLFDSLSLSIKYLGEELNYSTITKDYLGDIFNSMEDMLIVVDRQNVILSINHAISQKLIYNKEELIHTKLNTILPNIDVLESTSFDYETGAFPNLYAQASDGKEIPISIHVSPFVRGDNQEIGSVIIARDISMFLDYKKKIENKNQELLTAKIEAENANKTKSSFLANISHEIRTPMNVIIGFAELLEKPNLELEKRDNFIRFIRESSNNLLNIINDLLDISKIESGQLHISKTEGKINQFLNEVYNYFNENKILYKKEAVQLILSNQLDNIDDVLLDFDRVKQILINIIGNAFKFTDVGSIKFGCVVKENNIFEFYISDSGIGIPHNKKDIIFQPFRQVDESLSRKYGGTGLGLSICKGLVECMGGKIWFESTENIGTTFYFTLPFKTTKKIEIKKEDLNKNYNWADKSILIVEDNDFNAEYLMDVLLQTGVKFQIAEDGETGLKLFNETLDLDLILMDIRLPDMNGKDVTKEIRKTNKDIIIIAQTAYASLDDRQNCLNNGFNDYLSKPIKPNFLLNTINKYLL